MINEYYQITFFFANFMIYLIVCCLYLHSVLGYSCQNVFSIQFIWFILNRTKKIRKMAANESTIDMGPGTHAIPLKLFRGNRLRVCQALRDIPNLNDGKTFILLQGGDSVSLYNTDVEYANFRQVSN